MMLALSSLSFASVPESYLFVQSAPSASLVYDKGNHYTLTLRNPPPHVWYFTDRPERKSGAVPVDKFLGLWKFNGVSDNFKQNPPNAAIALMTVNSDKVGMVVTITEPEHDGDSLVYHLTKISKGEIPSGEYSQAILFIDNVQWGPGGL